MADLFGWMGNILRVDLTRKTISLINTEKYVSKYIDGQRIIHRSALDEIPKGIGAFDPRNKIMIMTRPLTGIPAPTSGRAECCVIATQGLPEQYTHLGLNASTKAHLKVHKRIFVSVLKYSRSSILRSQTSRRIKFCHGGL